jgi:hypothetical protein
MPATIGSVGGRRATTTGSAEEGAGQTVVPLHAFGLKRSSSSRMPYLWAPSDSGSSQVQACSLRRVVWSAAATMVTTVSPAPTVPIRDVPAVPPGSAGHAAARRRVPTAGSQ